VSSVLFELANALEGSLPIYLVVLGATYRQSTSNRCGDGITIPRGRHE